MDNNFLVESSLNNEKIIINQISTIYSNNVTTIEPL